jgi:hypothetical protein
MWVKSEGFNLDTFKEQGHTHTVDGFYWALVDTRFYATYEEAVGAVEKIAGKMPQYQKYIVARKRDPKIPPIDLETFYGKKKA